MHFDYIKVVVELICINDKLTLTLTCSKEQWPDANSLFSGAACSSIVADQLDLSLDFGVRLSS